MESSPPRPLDLPTTFPIYHIEGTGSFAAIDGRVRRPSKGARHLEGRPIREVLEEALEMEVEVLAVEPRRREWKKWAGAPYG